MKKILAAKYLFFCDVFYCLNKEPLQENESIWGSVKKLKGKKLKSFKLIGKSN